VRHSKENNSGYLCVKGSDKFVYALFSGKPLFDEDSNSSNIVICFDWNGNIVRKYKLDVDVNQITVDYADSYLYGIKEESERSSLYKFKL
jgi:hypothetical protein